VDDLIQHVIEATLEYGSAQFALAGGTLVVAHRQGTTLEVWTTRILDHAVVTPPKFAVGDRVRPTVLTWRFLAPGAIPDSSVVREVGDECVRLDSIAYDFVPGGVPVAWLEKVE